MDTQEKDIVEIKERLIRIEVLLEQKVGGLYERVKKLEDNQKWLVRTVVGVVIAAVLAVVGLK